MKACNINRLIRTTCLILLLGVSGNALAVFVDLASSNTQLNGHSVASVQDEGQSIVTESGPMELDFNAALRNNSPLVLDVLLDEDDRRPYIAFSANIINLSAEPLDLLILELSGGATFDNTVNLSASGLIEQDPTQRITSIALDSPITPGSGLAIGQPDGMASFEDWLIDLNNLMAGDRFTLTISSGRTLTTAASPIPEPGMLTLMAVALLVLNLYRQSLVKQSVTLTSGNLRR